MHEFNFNSLPIPVEEICEKLGIKLYFLTGLSCESMIGSRSSKTVILVDENVKNAERIRFSIAHELGHYKIPSHLKSVYKCTQEDLYHYSPVKVVEMEANRFAGELLMPTKFFEADVRRLPLSLSSIISLTNK
ncbi:MAG: ImmA/IrrE family metallo-endopeptidase [Desulfitobacteriaceae bacterium]